MHTLHTTENMFVLVTKNITLLACSLVFLFPCWLALLLGVHSFSCRRTPPFQCNQGPWFFIQSKRRFRNCLPFRQTNSFDNRMSESTKKHPVTGHPAKGAPKQGRVTAKVPAAKANRNVGEITPQIRLAALEENGKR